MAPLDGQVTLHAKLMACDISMHAWMCVCVHVCVCVCVCMYVCMYVCM